MSLNPLFTFALLALLAGCTTQQITENSASYTDPSTADTTPWYRTPADEMSEPCGYIDQNGDTLIPAGTYMLCWTDTATTFAIVHDGTDFLAINREGKRLYEVYFYDNGPDWLSDGLFRIRRNGLIGYADAQGQIVIEPQFECASQFENGIAQVALNCELIPDGEYTRQESKEWFYIDKEGQKVNSE
jgi:hypothetical protein